MYDLGQQQKKKKIEVKDLDVLLNKDSSETQDDFPYSLEMLQEIVSVWLKSMGLI